MKRYRVAIVGCGSRSAAHAEADALLENAELVACCAPSPGRRDVLAARFGMRAYADPAEMIRAERPDLVHLVTWPDTRVPLMTLVSDLQVPACTVEKPIARGVADWQALCELDARTRTKFAVCHQFRWQEDLTRCRETIRSGELGAVRLLDLSAGMNVSGQGTHVLNYARSLIDDSPIIRVFGAVSGASEMRLDGHPAPNEAVAALEFANGVRGLWTNGPTAPRCGPDPATSWQHVRLVAYAERGSVRYEEFGVWEIVSPQGIERGDCGGMAGHAERNLRAQSAFHRSMFDWIEDDAKTPGTALRQSLHEWKAVLALYASALERRPIALASFSPAPDLFESLTDTLNAAEEPK